jgi:hypothetical protein
VLVAAALLVSFSLVCGLGVVVNNTATIGVGAIGFTVTLLVCYVVARVRTGAAARSRESA